MNIPLSLYIHVPWCERKCPYCDFNSHLPKASIDEAGYVNHLLTDLDQDLNDMGAAIQERELVSIFVGGGTPSLLSPAAYSQLLSELKHRLSFSDEIEITLEANPGSSETDKFSGFRDAGINRLSIGIQSFNDVHLKALGRVHGAEHALKAAGAACQAGYDNFNLDLMFGLPDQSLAQSLEDVRQAIEMRAAHLSCYQLTIEPNTLFYAQPPILPDDDRLWEMQTAIKSSLRDANYHQYEVSAYAREDQACKHNLNYWQFGDYLGIGAGAHSKVSHHTNGKLAIERRWKLKNPSQYSKSISKLGGKHWVAQDQVAFEFMLNALRLNQGVSASWFEQRTGLSISSIDMLLDQHRDAGLIERSQERIAPTQFGHDRLNTMLEDYLPDAAA